MAMVPPPSNITVEPADGTKLPVPAATEKSELTVMVLGPGVNIPLVTVMEPMVKPPGAIKFQPVPPVSISRLSLALVVAKPDTGYVPPSQLAESFHASVPAPPIHL
jgi:hypothetical protein